ncbi:MAG: hypothetical protein ACSHXK_13970 [Oceanococcus sp.]
MSNDLKSFIEEAEQHLTRCAGKSDIRIAPPDTQCQILKAGRADGESATLMSELSNAGMRELMSLCQGHAQISPLAATRVTLVAVATGPDAQIYLLIRDCLDHIELEAVARTVSDKSEHDLELLYLLCADNGKQLGTRFLAWSQPPSAIEFEIKAGGENLVDAIWSLFDACDYWAQVSDSNWGLPPQPDLLSKHMDSLDQNNLKLQLLDEYKSLNPQPSGFSANAGWHMRMSDNLRAWKVDHQRKAIHPVSAPLEPDAIKRFVLAEYLSRVLSLDIQKN